VRIISGKFFSRANYWSLLREGKTFDGFIFIPKMKMMKSFFSVLSLFGKLSLLGCFSFFGGHCGTVEATTVSPCHVSAAERALEENTAAPCGQCENSVHAWSEPIVYVSFSQEEFPIFFSACFFEENEEELNVDEILVSPVKRPPDEIENEAFKKVAKSTIWQNSDCFILS
jgi:hypothetical protein